MDKTTTRRIHGSKCAHAPTGNYSTFLTSLEFLFRRENIINASDETATCILCGSLLQAPSQFYSAKFIVCRTVISIIVGFASSAFMLSIGAVIPQYLDLLFICAYILFFGSVFAIGRIADSIIFSIFPWQVSEMNSMVGHQEGDCIPALRMEKEAFCKKWKQRRQAALWIGCSVIPLMFGFAAVYL